MTPEDNNVTIICAQGISRGTEGRWAKCDKYGKKIWLSHSSVNALLQHYTQEQIDKLTIKTMCIPCGAKNVKSAEGFLPLTKEQIAEIVKAFKKKGIL